jgi:RND family efflux transporter MFP subunit
MKPKFRSRILFLLPVFFTLLAGCGSKAGGDGTPTPYPTLERVTYAVQRGDIVIDTKLYGTVNPVEIRSVSFQMDGQVDHVYVQPNEAVMKGQLLADLKELKELEANAKEVRQTVERAQVELEIAQTLLAKYRAGGYSVYDIKIQELNVHLAELNLEDVIAKYGLGDMQTALDAIDAQVDAARVYAPVDGLILSKVSSGQSVSMNTVAFVIGDANQLEISATPTSSPPEDSLKMMFEGMPVTVVTSAKPDQTLTGKIRQLPLPYGSGEKNDNSVRIVLDNPPSLDTYQAGDKVTVQVRLADKKGILWLPPVAVHQVGGRTFVIVDSDTGPQRIEIEIGLQTLEKVEILSGLEEGQVVIGL